MRNRLAFCAVALAAVLAVPAAGAASQVDLDATLTGSVSSVQGNCCGDLVLANGVVKLPGLVGNGTFTVELGLGTFDYTDMGSQVSLRLSIVAANGDTLLLRGVTYAPYPEPLGPLVWSVDPDGSSGRYARFAGSGTFTYEWDVAAWTLEVHLIGTLMRS